jgi:hypothetical protein
MTYLFEANSILRKSENINEAIMDAKISSLRRIFNCTILFAVAFNVTYFIHELAMVVGAHWLGNDPILFTTTCSS